MSLRIALARAVSSEEGVYGLILVAGLIAASGTVGSPAWKTLLLTAVTVAVFWTAHVYAGSVALHGERKPDGTVTSGREAFRHSVGKARGMLAACVFPALALLLGAFGWVSDFEATWISLWVCVGTLATLGFLNYMRKGAPWYRCVIGAVTTASFGILIVLAKVFIAH